jgi:p-cumate 2,3-dioxygenase subunit alpha
MQQMNTQPYIVENPQEMTFRVNRRTMVDAEILEQERRRIFDTCWIYVGHDSELKAPGDYRTRIVCGRPVIFSRGMTGTVHAFLNTCTHRGAVVCREAAGNAKRMQCFYHGWSFDPDGKLVGVPGEDAYGPHFKRDAMGLKPVPRLDSYRDFWFLSFNPDAPPLLEYLAGATEYIDLVVDQSPSGKMEIIRGTQEYEVAANWKLMVENSFDDYHLITTHTTWLRYLKDAGVEMQAPAPGQLLPAAGKGRDLGNGHATTDNVNFRGRPVAKWIPIYGEDSRTEIDAIRAELVRRVGPERATRICDTNRNLLIFPNLMLNDGSSVTVRTFHPVAPDRMKVTAWALGPVEESPSARARRLDSFLTFYGPGGFATPDDVEALESVQSGFRTWREVPWSDISRGMNKQGEKLNTDERHIRAFWRRWNSLMDGGA